MNEQNLDFSTQQEIWQWLVDGNKITHKLIGFEVYFMGNGELNMFPLSQASDWKKHIGVPAWCNDTEYRKAEIKQTPEQDLKVDDLVWVWNSGESREEWSLRYFSRYDSSGCVFCWENGATSLTSKGRDAAWYFWEKYDPEPVNQNPEPKWHKYLDQGYGVICFFWDETTEGEKYEDIAWSFDGQYYDFVKNNGGFLYEHAEPILTECGNFCTCTKDGKTFLLPLE